MADTSQSYVINNDSSLWLWNSATNATTNLGTFHFTGSDTVLRFLDVAVAPDGQVYAVGGSQIFRLDLETHVATALFNSFKVISGFEINPDGQFILGYDTRDYIDVLDPVTFAVLKHFRTDPSAGTLFGGPTSAGDLVLVGNTLHFAAKHALGTSHPDEIIVYDMATGTILDRWENPLAADTQGLYYDNGLIGFIGNVAYRISASGYTLLHQFDPDWDVNGASNGVALHPTAGADRLHGTPLAEAISALAGDDTIYALQGDDTVDGGAGSDLIYGGDGNDDLSGGATTADRRDVIHGGDGNDSIGGGFSNDAVYGEAGRDSLSGGTGADRCFGGGGADRMFGNEGADSLYGGDGNDQINGGTGADMLAGGAGNDSFVFANASEAGETIADFSNAAGNNDRFLIRAAGFASGIAAGVLAADQFVIRNDNQAQVSNDHIIYNTSDHTLWFDANGSAAGGLTLLAHLTNAPTLSAQDFVFY